MIGQHPLFIVWNDSYNTGIKIIDDQHRGLISVINSLYFSSVMQNGKALMKPFTDMVLAYTQTHFTLETELLQESGYPLLQEHQAQHEAILLKINRDISPSGSGNALPDFLDILREWFLVHILREDKAYSAHLLEYFKRQRRLAADLVPPSPAMTAIKATRPNATVKPELFEKLNTLIENFEMDDAVSLLRTLLAYTYNAKVDDLLTSILVALTRYDYDAALVQVKSLLRLTRSGDGKDRDAEDRQMKKKVLAIDDMPDALMTVKAFLKNDYTVYGVTNHMAALRFLTGNTADIILLDIEMRDMNGFALLEIIRKLKTYETTPVLFLTGNVSVENIKKAHNAGGNDFIKKPVDAKVLQAKIKKHLAGTP